MDSAALVGTYYVYNEKERDIRHHMNVTVWGVCSSRAAFVLYAWSADEDLRCGTGKIRCGRQREENWHVGTYVPLFATFSFSFSASSFQFSLVMRAALSKSNINIVAVNDPFIPTNYMKYMLQYGTSLVKPLHFSF